MMRNALIVLGLVLCFLVGGFAIYRYKTNSGQTPFLRATAGDLTGTWQSQSLALKIEARGEQLEVAGLADRPIEFVRDGKASRWVEKAPQTPIPRTLDWNGHTLLFTSVDASAQRQVSELQRSKKQD